MATKKTTKKATTKKAAPTEPSVAGVLHIERLRMETIAIPIRGTTPLIMHRFSEKAKRKMADAQQGRKSQKVPRNPQEEFEEASYRLNGGYGFPAKAFEKATVGAARFYGADVKMTDLRRFLFFLGEHGDDGIALVDIESDEPRMREDVVRIARGATDLRYRPEFRNWKTTLIVKYISSAISRDSVLSLVDAGGIGGGVGDWREERDGDFGSYEIDMDRQVEFVS